MHYRTKIYLLIKKQIFEKQIHVYCNYQVVQSEASLDKLLLGVSEHAPTPLTNQGLNFSVPFKIFQVR